jgi:DNA replication protein DnaC
VKAYTAPSLLLIDGFGHILWDRDRAALFFEVIAKRYEAQASFVRSSNRDFGEWERVFGDTTLASATLDRIFQVCKVFLTAGESYRLRSRKRTP